MAIATQRLGITGGIGSGKSTVANLLAGLGAIVIDADAISRAATAVGGSAIPAIQATFGQTLLTAEGALDREQMRALVYSDPGAKKQLEAIVHPLVGETIAQQAQQAEHEGAPCIVFDIPLLVESAHWRQSLHRILVVDCTEETQIVRVVARNALNPADVQKIIAAQVPRAQRLAAADWVLFNDGITFNHLAHYAREIGRQFGL